ncbi:MAG: SusC/RagA family protein, partial [Cytophagales bacterium CG18_big_fil_WC_8_21_14_2_50_42_9]
MGFKTNLVRPIFKGICMVSVLCAAPAHAGNMPGMIKAEISQPTQVISGQVTDGQRQPIIGATIRDKNSNIGTATDMEGRFSLDVNAGTTLTVSMIGYITQEVIVPNQGVLSIQLKENTTMLNEVVAIGYQTMRKSDVTGAISSVKAKELNVTAPTVGQSLVGKVAGVQVSQVSGAPYAGTKIRVRGVGSVNASSDPLYVI